MVEITTSPFLDQQPGTSGLRKRVTVFQQPGYVENFVQSTFDVLDITPQSIIIVGGDGRFFNRAAIQIIIKMAVANRFGRIVIGRGGILSTPAASHLIRSRKAIAGLVLSASHNPGGPNADFGIKLNVENGGPAPSRITELVYERSKSIEFYKTIDIAEIDIDHEHEQTIGGTIIEVVDPVKDYSELMGGIFDFAKIRELFHQGFRIRFDAMNAVTGPYARAILEDRLGAPEGSVVNATPLEDFGGHHPDPNLVHAKELYDYMMTADAPDFGAASDGDGDRNLIIGRGIYVSPSDSLAILAANAHLAPAYAGGVSGIARSMPTSRAADRVANALGVPIYETPTGWKFFGNLLDAGLVSICGEESAGTGSGHIREKDGVWAVLLWLNILAEKKASTLQIVSDHWQSFGRNYYARYDYEAIEEGNARSLMGMLRAKLATLPGMRFGEFEVSEADEISYADPVDYSVALGQGLRIGFSCGSRIVYRLSGTGTDGATLRVYIERYEPPTGNLHLAFEVALAGLANAATTIADIHHITGRDRPDVIT